MSDRIHENAMLFSPLGEPRECFYKKWVKSMAEDAQTISVTKLNLPIVIAIAVMTSVITGVSTLAFTAGSKTTNLGDLQQQVTTLTETVNKLSSKVSDSSSELSKSIAETSQQSAVTSAKVDGLSKQVDVMQNQIEQLRQQSTTRR